MLITKSDLFWEKAVSRSVEGN